MGKGDRKTKRGKIWLGTFGKLRRPSENIHKVNPEAKNQVTPKNS